jgi:hypothetical protein
MVTLGNVVLGPGYIVLSDSGVDTEGYRQFANLLRGDALFGGARFPTTIFYG